MVKISSSLRLRSIKSIWCQYKWCHFVGAKYYFDILVVKNNYFDNRHFGSRTPKIWSKLNLKEEGNFFRKLTNLHVLHIFVIGNKP